MADIAIWAENLSKLYRIGTKRARYKTIRESLTEGLLAPLRRLRGNRQSAIGNRQSDLIWALKDISFDVKQGEVIGIIGRNGAGKSTLLKILSRITKPTQGRAEIHGRVGSLLEVGTGFHPELTGRENIYLNGAILGMKKTEIDSKFDEMVAFAEVEKFIDTPVKHYSSGMYVRLAFAVAAHLEPEILLVDEVLAVGDAAFQKKCLGKMGDVAREGHTVLFVSHNLPAITQLCARGIWLNEGKLMEEGVVSLIVSKYLADGLEARSGHCCWRMSEAPGNSDFRLLAARVCDVEGNAVSVVDLQRPLLMELEYQVLRYMRQLRVYFVLHDSMQHSVFVSTDVDSSSDAVLPRTPGRYRSQGQIWPNLLKPGDYTVSVGAVDHGSRQLCLLSHAFRLHITAVDGLYATDWHLRDGAVTPRLPWIVERLGD